MELGGVIVHGQHRAAILLVGLTHIDGPCTGFARTHDQHRAVGVLGGHFAHPLTQRMVQKQPPSQAAAADEQKDEHRGHAVGGIEQHTVDKTAVHHIHHSGGHGDHSGKADQIPLAGVLPQHRVQPARQKADDIHRHDPRQVFVQQGTVVGPPPGLHGTVCPQQQGKIKAECHNGCIQQHQQRTAQQHLRGILGSIFHLRSSFSLSAPRVCPALLFRQCSPPAMPEGYNYTFVLYSQSPPVSRKFTFLSLSPVFPGLCLPQHRPQLLPKPQRQRRQ